MATIGKRAQYLPLVNSTAEKNKVDARLLDAIVTVESAYNPWAMRFEPNFQFTAIPDSFAKTNKISIVTERQCQKFSWGLAQIMGGTARFLGFTGPLSQLLNPDMNLVYACKLLGKLMDEYDTIDEVAAAYNAGSVRKNSSGQYVNQEYVDKVSALLKVNETQRS